MKSIISLILLTVIFISCTKHKADYPFPATPAGSLVVNDTTYILDIRLANKTNYDINVNLYPNSQITTQDSTYLASSYSGQFLKKMFLLKKYDSIGNVASIEYLYTTKDTSITPSGLLSNIFDSISAVVSNDSNLMIKFDHTNLYNYSENPFSVDSIWHHAKTVNTYTLDKTKEFTYFIDPKKLRKK